MQILQEKWNETRSAGLIVNDGNATRLENGFFAVGLQLRLPCQQNDGQPWGSADSTTQLTPIIRPTAVHAFQPAWWNTDGDHASVKPPLARFCDASNQCRPGESHTPNDPDVVGEPVGPCAHRNSAGQYNPEMLVSRTEHLETGLCDHLRQ
ncbi:hypothetical protein [Asanoa siamensis]|uniref:Uncharacterized protein n=1 Tax=Asanoa siamensis TaxID=926357 RepID=A0ABQ4D4Y9_9ACTN|nr:hypothetical protein [Asanoa siamensis]GIF78594.1 hypothetical protein Asi02nite_81120 [Asanoa siamensis]